MAETDTCTINFEIRIPPYWLTGHNESVSQRNEIITLNSKYST